MKPAERAYIAGLMDGEGCFRIERFATARSPIGFQYRTIAEIAMCDYEPMAYVAGLTSRTVLQKSKTTTGGRVVYLLTWRNSKAADLIRLILPHLRGKTEQARLCLYFEEHITPGRGHTYKPEDRERCDSIRERVAALKRSPALRC